MTRFILDASIAIKWVLPETDSLQALQLRDDYLNQVHDLIAPDIFPIEVAHSLTRAERKQIIPLGSAQPRITDVLAAAPSLYSYLALLPRAVDLSSQLRIGVYDCIYLALAEHEQCSIVTADKRLIQGATGHSILQLADL